MSQYTEDQAIAEASYIEQVTGSKCRTAPAMLRAYAALLRQQSTNPPEIGSKLVDQFSDDALKEWEEFGRQIENRLRYNEWGFNGSYPEIIDQVIALVRQQDGRVDEARPCTCHPDDNPPNPCAQRYALTDCRAAIAQNAQGERESGIPTSAWMRAITEQTMPAIAVEVHRKASSYAKLDVVSKDVFDDCPTCNGSGYVGETADNLHADRARVPEVTFDMVKEIEHLCPTDRPHLDRLRWKAKRLNELLAIPSQPAQAVDVGAILELACQFKNDEFGVDEFQDKLTRAVSGEKSGWQPIETAPKDGRYMLLCTPNRQPYSGRWIDGEWQDAMQLCRDPSHWMPLPPAPNKES